MEADFSGYATKAGLKCTDGRTIMPNAFQHQDKMRVPLVWQHGHSDPENVLGHAILENRQDGVYAYGFFNNSDKAKHARGLVQHKDISMLSIWANQLIERSGKVIHGAIREVSLVLSGANPGALIENVTIQHSDGDEQIIEDEAIIFTGLELEFKHSVEEVDEAPDIVTDNVAPEEVATPEIKEPLVELTHADSAPAPAEDPTVQDVYDSMTEEQKTVLHFMIGEALSSVGHSDISDDDQEGTTTMTNVFETQGEPKSHSLSHDDMQEIVSAAVRGGSLKHAVEEYALAHGITDIDYMFPDAQAIDSTPEWLQRRTEWVGQFLGATRKSPFSRIKTLSADITEEEARAKGYITGSLKKEEFFSVNKRSTTPTTVYKKQKLDRDDVVDITDFDVVTWLKGEMRVMLDEEIARAALIGDGRDISHEDKIDAQCIRPIAYDNELFTTVVNVNIDDANSSVQEIIDALVLNRSKYKGTGLPTFYTTETYVARFLLLKDSLGRRIYSSLADIALELRCAEIVPVEVMEEVPEIVGILVNPVDYVFGSDRGGEINMFDDFDIDYNNLKYLIETRCSGALVKLKSAIVIKKVASRDVLVTPTAPTFVPSTGVLTITDTTGVVYTKLPNTVVNASGSPYAAISPGASITIVATPASGYYFATSDDDTWTFTRELT